MTEMSGMGGNAEGMRPKILAFPDRGAGDRAIERIAAEAGIDTTKAPDRDAGYDEHVRALRDRTAGRFLNLGIALPLAQDGKIQPERGYIRDYLGGSLIPPGAMTRHAEKKVLDLSGLLKRLQQNPEYLDKRIDLICETLCNPSAEPFDRNAEQQQITGARIFANMTGAKIYPHHFTDCDFSGSTLMNAGMRGCTLDGTTSLAGCSLRWAEVLDTDFVGTSFDGVDLSFCKFENVSFRNVDFTKLKECLLVKFKNCTFYADCTLPEKTNRFRSNFFGGIDRATTKTEVTAEIVAFPGSL